MHLEAVMPTSTEKAFPLNKSVAEWVALLKNRRPSMRRQAASALGQLSANGKLVVPALIAALGDKNELVRRQAAESLGELGPKAKAAVGPLGEVLSDEWEFIRQQ